MRDRTILILGGTREAARLAERLVGRPATRLVTSLAGRTENPASIAGEVRTGGFGGAGGLADFLVAKGIDLLVDATHPFASRISANAEMAAKAAQVHRVVLLRPDWRPQEGDRWRMVDTLEEAARALPGATRAFLALGSQHLAPFAARPDCHFVVRMIDAPADRLPLAAYDLVVARPGSEPEEESRLFEYHRIGHVVCRNSGGNGARAKLDAARALGLDVVMVRRPEPPAGETFPTVETLADAIG